MDITLDLYALARACGGDVHQDGVLVPGPDRGPKSANMAIWLPLGINLTEPMLLRVDNGPPEKQPVQTCTNVGCLSNMTIPDKFLAAMRIGNDMKIAFQASNKQSIDLMMPLAGFSLAFDKAR